jgi:hypothetical protein
VGSAARRKVAAYSLSEAAGAEIRPITLTTAHDLRVDTLVLGDLLARLNPCQGGEGT